MPLHVQLSRCISLGFFFVSSGGIVFILLQYSKFTWSLLGFWLCSLSPHTALPITEYWLQREFEELLWCLFGSSWEWVSTLEWLHNCSFGQFYGLLIDLSKTVSEGCHIVHLVDLVHLKVMEKSYISSGTCKGRQHEFISKYCPATRLGSCTLKWPCSLAVPHHRYNVRC